MANELTGRQTLRHSAVGHCALHQPAAWQTTFCRAVHGVQMPPCTFVDTTMEGRGGVVMAWLWGRQNAEKTEQVGVVFSTGSWIAPSCHYPSSQDGIVCGLQCLPSAWYQ